MELDIALIQLELEDGNKKKNIEKVLELLNQLKNSEYNVDIACLPELFSTGWYFKHLKEIAEPFVDDTIKKIINISKGYFTVIGSILESDNNKFHNTAFIIGKNGEIIGKYRKIHLYGLQDEKKHLIAGNKILTFNIPEIKDLKIGIAICYDIRFPELFRKMTQDGAQLIFLPAQFPEPKSDIWEILIKARAIENQIYMIGINRVGIGTNQNYFGKSIVTNGIKHIMLGSNQEVKIVRIDLESLTTIRKQLPLIQDRRIDLY
ncbi:MAG: nitrilase-related carbon-nitrogen hydrolase [Promethearchaeota archaeon]